MKWSLLLKMKTPKMISLPMPANLSAGALLINVLKFILGAIAIVIGSDLLIDNGSLLATMLGSTRTDHSCYACS